MKLEAPNFAFSYLCILYNFDLHFILANNKIFHNFPKIEVHLRKLAICEKIEDVTKLTFI